MFVQNRDDHLSGGALSERHVEASPGVHALQLHGADEREVCAAAAGRHHGGQSHRTDPGAAQAAAAEPPRRYNTITTVTLKQLWLCEAVNPTDWCAH